ncbi:hypothetical protein BDZ94DRAFT_1209818 [Collybia nuda]|uniref:Uncharacterized protein n=1 Tax=Collybia nuda TaxID=64659 RepID=A0A9P5YGD9_9AGAR|nr:hypothetical protein BDZ94DRAFT_1209818 [Collybia nuda]
MQARTASRDAEKISLQRQNFKAQLETAINEEDDPLAVYYQFVQWTIKNYGENDSDSGLLELLEKATREFKEDPIYKTDLRYLKLWSLYARQVERGTAIKIYADLLSSEIGISYSTLYEEYAALLEADGKLQEAERIYTKGIKRQARPVERLKNRYREFQGRTPSSSTLPPPPNSMSVSAPKRTQGDALRKKPLKSQGGQSKSMAAPTSLLHVVSSSAMAPFSTNAESRYALMLAPPAPGKRPEKLRFELGLLFTEEGVEYSIQEARARSMGLLGKKWGPPPVSEAFRLPSSSSMPVNFNDDGQKSTRLTAMAGRRRSIMSGAEPTVTINTKEALADVFGMYNSPEKTVKGPGSKHAPLKKVEAITPVAPPRFVLNRENENVVRNAKTPTPAFRPFVDENAKPNRTTPGEANFTPFMDPESKKIPLITPRPALSLKDSTPVPSFSPESGDNTPRALGGPKPTPTPGDTNAENVFSSNVFTPAQVKSPPLPVLRDVFTDDFGRTQTKVKPAHERAKSHHDILASAPEEALRPTTFIPFVDENVKTPFKVFSRPPENAENSNAFTPKTPAFTPFADPKPAFTPFRDVPISFTPFRDEIPTALSSAEPDIPTQPQLEKVVVIEDSLVEDDSADEEPETAQEPGRYEDDYEYEEAQYEEGESYQEAPLGGRFGKFNVMTPITERTFEFTTSTRGGGSTPSERLRYISEDGDSTYENVFIPQKRDEHGAIIVAEQLAAELREDIEAYSEDEPIEPLRLSTVFIPQGEEPATKAIEEKTGTLSLSDTLALNSKFKPSNPCNPFDPAIMTAILSRIPVDPYYYDLRNREANMLDSLQKFSKKGRKTSGNSSNNGVLETCFPLVLDGHKFSVSEKLGEGGFGAVFKAQDLGTQRAENSDDDDDDDDDDDSISMVALKVVKPRNLWEYHVLRRLHSTLPATLRRSVILPHALYAFRDESYLVLDLCPQGTLLSIVNNAVSAGISQQGGSLDELLVMFFAIELIRLLQAMHDAGFIHGDLKIDNCLLRLEDVPGGVSAWSSLYQPSGENGWSYKGLKVIDFGRTVDTRLFPVGQQYIAEWPTDDRDCFEVRENRPWTYQTDYFGLVGIIYCMLFGKYIQEGSVMPISVDGQSRYKIATPLKRYWQTDLWNRLFDTLLNPCLVKPQGQLPVSEILEGLREEMEAWLEANCNRTSNTLKGLLKKVEVSCFVN